MARPKKIEKPYRDLQDGSRYNIKWSPHRYGVAKTCLRQYYYSYLVRPRPVTTISPDIAVGSLLHNRIETFYQTKGKHVGEPKKDTAKDFAKSTLGMWHYRVMRYREGKMSGPQLTWKDPKDAYRIWGPTIYQLAVKIWEEYSKLPPPLEVEFETPILQVDDGAKYWGIIDEIRYPLTIRDHKSRKTQISEYDLRYNPQFTVYAAVLSIMCAKDPIFAVRVGCTPEDLVALSVDPLAIIGKVKLEHHFLETGFVDRTKRERRVEVFVAPTRKPEHFFEILDQTADLEYQIAQGDFKPNRGYHCNFCAFKDLCQRHTEAGVETRMDVQYDLFQPVPKPPEPRVRANARQIKFDFMKPEPGERPDDGRTDRGDPPPPPKVKKPRQAKLQYATVPNPVGDGPMPFYQPAIPRLESVDETE